MNLYYFVRGFSGVWIVILLLISGCTEPTQTSLPPLLSPTPSQQPEATFTQAPTLIPTSTETAAPSSSATPSPSPPPTSTMTPLPTLDPTQAFLVIQEFLSQGMDCPAPCFLGIIPGQSTFDQAINILNSLGQPIFHSNIREEYYSSEYNIQGLPLVVKLQIAHRRVKNIELGIALQNYEGDPKWRGFSLNAMINKYGPPSQVGFVLPASPSLPGSEPEYANYGLIVYYEPLDLTIDYDGMTKEGNILKICPFSDHFDGVGIYIGKDPENRPDIVAPLEKVSSLNITQFSELMTQTSKPACFDISKEAYGPPFGQ